MPTSNLDDLLLGGKTATQPQTPEHQEPEENIETEETESPDYGETSEETISESQDEDDKSDEPKLRETDEYGNEAEPENEAIRERLARQAKKHQAEIDSLRSQLSELGASREVQKAASDFEYNPEESGDWQQQLASFVKQTVNTMSRDEENARSRAQEAKIQAEFESKFRDGMGRFNDFTETLTGLPFEISNPMTLATRAMADPAAFLYAAAKRQPAELERISKIRDPYAQMTEMGKLEERMRRNKPSTNAPRPLGRTVEDAGTKESPKKKSEPTIEDLIAQSDAKKMKRRKAGYVGRR